MDPLLDVSWLHLESSSGLAERFQHLKELTIVALLVVIAWRRGGLAYWSWALLFAYVFCDDVFKLHQNVGQHLSEIVELANPMMGSQIMAELLVSFVAGSCLFSVIGVTYAVGSEVFRTFSRDLILLFSLFAFFGIVVDLIPALCHLNHVITFMMVGIEEVGGVLVSGYSRPPLCRPFDYRHLNRMDSHNVLTRIQSNRMFAVGGVEKGAHP